MTEPDDTKMRSLRALFSRKKLLRLAISVLVATILGAAIDFALHTNKAELSSLRADAYASIAQFAPWNVAERYVQIVFTQGDEAAQRMAEQQQQRAGTFRDFACRVRGNYSAGQDNPCTPLRSPHGLRAFYLSARVPSVLRPITAFFDLLLHALFDQGVIGFLVAAAQIGIGVLATRFAIRHSFMEVGPLYTYVLGIPAAILVLGSVAAVPLWLLAFVGVTVFKALPAAGLGAQAGGTAYFVSLIGGKTLEDVGHEAIMKQVKRVVHD